MRTKLYSLSVALILLLTLLLNSGAHAFAADDTEELKRQIEALQRRVDELEAEREADGGGGLGLFNRRRAQRWDPFEEMHRMQEEMDRMFQDSFNWGGGNSRGIFSSDMYYDDTFDIVEEDDKYIIAFNMKGFDQDKVDIQINQQSITIKGERSAEKREEDPNRYFSSKSISTYLKSIPVPEDADTTKMKTEQKKDKLIITLPKKKMLQEEDEPKYKL